MKVLFEIKNCKLKKYGIICIAPLMTIVILLLIYFLKGIYPFGDNFVAYYDMSQNYVPIYYHTFDVLHGYKSSVFDWYSGLGGSMIDVSGNYVYNPINIFFFFVKRNRILESMSFFLMLKLMISAFTMSCYMSERVDDSEWIVFSGILYASCGYVLQYYTNIHFLDIVIIFPLLIWAYERMMNYGKGITYTIIMALCLITNIYMMFMVSIYLIIKSFFVTRTCNNRKIMIKRLGEYTFLAFLLSAFCTIPAILQLLNSSRILNAQSNSYFNILTNITCSMKEQKIFMFYGCECIIAMFFCIICKYKAKIIKYKQDVYVLLFLIIPICVENVNLLWHTGSYQHFPMRFGYVLSFEFLCFASDFIKEKEYLLTINRKVQTCAKIISISILPMIVVVLAYFLMGFQEYGIRELRYYHAYSLIALLLVFYYIIVLLVSDKKKTFVLAGIMIICQMFFGYFGFVAPQKVYSLECTNDIITKTQLLKRNIDLESSNPLLRIKNSDTSLNANYPFILQRAAISNWTFGTDATLQNNLKKLGYSTNYTRLLDSGGTIFTDALLGIKNVITKEELDVNLYSCIEKSEEGNYYSCCYQLPFGCIMENDINLEEEEIINKFQYQNMLFRNITGIDQSLIITYNIDDLVTSQRINESSNSYQLQIPITNKSVLYIYSFDDANEKYEFQINGQKKEIPFLSVEDNYVYPAAFNNGLLECGVYENEVVELDINVYGEDLRNLMVGSLDLKLFEQGIDQINSSLSIEASAGKASLSIKGKAEKDGILFLPIGYNDGWNATINGKKVNVMPVMSGSFCGISMQKGEFELELNYVPRGFIIGIILSIVSLILLLFMIIMKKESRSDENIGILTVGFNIAFYLLAIGIIIFIYVLPIIAWTVVKVVEIWLFGI